MAETDFPLVRIPPTVILPLVDLSSVVEPLSRVTLLATTIEPVPVPVPAPEAVNCAELVRFMLSQFVSFFVETVILVPLMIRALPEEARETAVIVPPVRFQFPMVKSPPTFMVKDPKVEFPDPVKVRLPPEVVVMVLLPLPE